MHPQLRDVDWPAVEQSAVELLCDLLRIDTSNPPGNERAAAELAADHLRGSGLDPLLVQAQPQRTNVVARMRGGDEPPLLLNAHLDVVAADAHRWAHPPFGGAVVDGWIWGRGTVDMKAMAAMSLVVIRVLADLGVPLRRDVVFAGVADEEAGCALGSAWLVDEHADLVRAGFALGEVGGFTQWVSGRPIYPVQVAEKGAMWLRARARGTSGHGSVPREDNPIVALSRFLARLGRTTLPVHRSPAIEAFLHGLAQAAGRPASAVLPLLLDPRASRIASRLLIRDRSTARTLAALVRNTVSPTVLRSGAKVNVIPAEAEAELDARIAVGSSGAELLAELRALAGERIELEPLVTREPHVAPADTPLFALIADVVAEHHPGAVAVPSVIPGFTDAHHWSRLGTICYGFAPVRLDPGGPAFAGLFHADDERIPVAGYRAGLRMLADVVARFCIDA